MQLTHSTKSILLIEDQVSVQELVKTCLSDLAGWNIVVVSSAQAGLRCVAGKHPDVILLDFLTPGMDAKTFMHKLHSDPLTASIPVIVLSARARGFTPLQLQQLGVVAAIAKPFNPMTLPDKIADALAGLVKLKSKLSLVTLILSWKLISMHVFITASISFTPQAERILSPR